MSRHTARHGQRSKKIGAAPGTLMHLGREKAGAVKLELIRYDGEHFSHKEFEKAGDLLRQTKAETQGVTWLNVDGIADVEIIREIGSEYGIHPLVLEDILAADQRPKTEDLGEYLFVVLKMLSVNKESGEIESEQVSFILGDNYLLSFQEGLDGDVFGPVRARLNNDKARIRSAGPDLLLHALLDVVVDNYFLVLEKLAERIEELEDELIEKPTSATLHAIYKMKREMLGLHKVVWPLREVAGGLYRRDSGLVGEDAVIYLRDLYDHAVQVLDTLETLRDTLSGMLDIYLSSVSNRMNEVMKVLTIIATIFMPLSFLVGWYGMNFKNMPELEQPYGYPVLLVVMALIASGMLYFFRRKRWL